MKEMTNSMKPIITKKSGNWTRGNIGPFRFEIKHYDEPSIYGIDEGRISKLWLRRRDSREVAASYDRGWDKQPSFSDDEAQDAVDALCTIWN